MRKFTSSVIGACALGAGFGAVTSFSNDLSSPFEGGDVVGVARVASLILGAAWAWAAVAVVAGWLARTPARGAVAGALALIAATTAYYVMDSINRQEPLVWYWPEMLRWWLASVICGPLLGGVGAYIGRPGAPGLLAGLAIPVCATLQLLLLPPGAGSPTETAAMNWARIIVVVTAALGAAAVVARFLLAERSRS